MPIFVPDIQNVHNMQQITQLTDFLPTTKKELELRGWDEVDIILFSGDAYVDHPTYGTAVIGRIIESEGFRIAIIPQPNWKDDLRNFKKLGTGKMGAIWLGFRCISNNFYY